MHDIQVGRLQYGMEVVRNVPTQWLRPDKWRSQGIGTFCSVQSSHRERNMKTRIGFIVLLLAGSLCARGTTIINPAQTLTGEIRSAGAVEVFEFVGTVGETVAILMGQTGGTDSFHPLVELRGPDGSLVAQGTGADAAYIAPRRLTSTSLYQIRCRDAHNLETAGFALTLIKMPGSSVAAPDGGTIAPGESKTGFIALGDLDTFDFTLAASASVQIHMRQISGTSHFDPALELYDGAGTLLATASGSESASISICMARSGTYQVLCRDEHVSFDAAYTLSLQAQPILPPLPANGPDDPSLAIVRCNTDVILQWRTNALGFRLESASMVPSTDWSPVADMPQAIEDRFSVTQAVTAGTRFYRLHRP